MKALLVLLVGVVLGVAGFRWYAARTAEATSPLLVLTQQVRTRAIVQQERQLAVWYRACPEVPGVNPQILVIWPGTLNYEIDLAAAQLELAGDVLTVRTPPIVVNEPAVPSDLGEYVTKSSIWTLASEQSIVLAEMQKASPLARHLSVYLLGQEPDVEKRFRTELEDYMRGIAGALGVPVSRVEVEIATAKRAVPPRPDIRLCEGTSAQANGRSFARRQADGTTIGVYSGSRAE